MASFDPLIVTKCPICDIQFSSADAFQLHYDEQHNKIKLEVDDFYTSRQNSQFQKSKRLKKPKAKLNPINTELLTCQYCSYSTKSEYLLQKHVQTQHNPHRKIYSCHLCNYFCLQERTFNLHKLNHLEQDAKFACDQCGKLFLSMVIMKRHALTHNKLKSFVCTVEGCERVFNIKSRLTDHMRYVHKKLSVESKCNQHEEKTEKGDKSIDNVSKMCPDNNSIHSSEIKEEDSTKIPTEKYAANVIEPERITVYDVILDKQDFSDFSRNNCDGTSNASPVPYFDFESTSNSDAVNKPTIKHEYCSFKPGKKNDSSKFTCLWTGCGKKFRDGFNFRMHTYTHTGEMQRACKLCGYTCVQKSALDRHIKVHERLTKELK